MARRLFWLGTFVWVLGTGAVALAQEQPSAIFHAFDQRFSDVEGFVCELGNQGFSHVQLSPVQKSNPTGEWYGRYQPIDYTVVEGRGSESDLRRLIERAHSCHVKVIADVVFNHMADVPEFHNLRFPGLAPADFHTPKCDINYNDGNRTSEMGCWLGTLPDLDQGRAAVAVVHKKHLRKLIGLGMDGFRFDAAKHMTPEAVKRYIDFINQESRGKTWNYLEVIQDGDTDAGIYTGIAAVTDFVLYRSMKAAFVLGGDLRSLRVAGAVDDPRSVTFGRNHDNIRELNPSSAIDPYSDRTDSFLATAFVLAREGGTPLIFNWDNVDSPLTKFGVKFRQIMKQRGASNLNVKENVLAVVDSPTVLIMERGAEGFFAVNKAAARFNVDALDLTLSNLEGCYRELRNNFNVAIQRNNQGKKFVTRWGTPNRGGMELQARDALYFIREPFSQCQVR